ncbi:MAG: radical SAM/SPASM domain-containing protein [Promethearchaeota archaeon]|jgi:radical SAM protein with 4Fe4S-binding SPASM domain
MKINSNYFSLSSHLDVIKYFVRQGNILAHLVDRVKWHIYPRYYITPKFPTHLEIEASSACNLRCPMCKSTEMRNAGIKFGRNMDWELYKKIIDECAKSSVYSIKLSWRGEPLIHPKIDSMVWYAKEKGIKDVAFLTNGVNLSKIGTTVLTEGVPLYKWLWSADLDWISISFDGFKEDYERIRHPAKFEQVINNVKQLREWRDRAGSKKPQIRVQSIQSAIEGREEEFLRLWDGIADKVYFIPDQVRTLEEKDYNQDPNYICPNPWQRMVIAADGTVPQCITDYSCGNILGDVNIQTISEIWHSAGFELFRKQMKEGNRLKRKPCRICEYGVKV